VNKGWLISGYLSEGGLGILGEETCGVLVKTKQATAKVKSVMAIKKELQVLQIKRNKRLQQAALISKSKKPNTRRKQINIKRQPARGCD
jgi:hypothetical protein